MSQHFVEYRGVRMVAGWPDRIEKAQRIRTYSSGGRDIPRIPYGSNETTGEPKPSRATTAVCSKGSCMSSAAM